MRVGSEASQACVWVRPIRAENPSVERPQEPSCRCGGLQLVDDRVELMSIAHVLREQLVAQTITDDEIAYITEKLIPTAETVRWTRPTGSPVCPRSRAAHPPQLKNEGRAPSYVYALHSRIFWIDAAGMR